MKRRLLYLLPVLLAMLSGCFGTKNNAPAPATPEGTFTGVFRLVHTSSKNGKRDTMRANIQLDMHLATGYKVTGDTATVHAGSYGSYSIGTNSLIAFGDRTFPTTGKPTKIHLSGVYEYGYDGSALQMVANGYQDTLSYQYDLKKVN